MRVTSEVPKTKCLLRTNVENVDHIVQTTQRPL